MPSVAAKVHKWIWISGSLYWVHSDMIEGHVMRMVYTCSSFSHCHPCAQTGVGSAWQTNKRWVMFIFLLHLPHHGDV